jgi:putative ABC transport system permease protein
VLASVRSGGPNQPYKPELYLSLTQTSAAGLALVLEPARVGGTLELPRLYALMVGVFATAAVLLAALGVYGVMAYSVAQRRREIGVRLALDATPSGVARMILGDGSRLAAIGLGVGLACALLVGQVIGKLLFGVSPYDAPTFVAVPLVLGAATLVASWLPARRAMRVDPLVAIREE